MGELVAGLRANGSDAFRGFLSEGMQELGMTEVKELLQDCHLEVRRLISTKNISLNID